MRHYFENTDRELIKRVITALGKEEFYRLHRIQSLNVRPGIKYYSLRKYTWESAFKLYVQFPSGYYLLTEIPIQKLDNSKWELRLLSN